MSTVNARPNLLFKVVNLGVRMKNNKITYPICLIVNVQIIDPPSNIPSYSRNSLVSFPFGPWLSLYLSESLLPEALVSLHLQYVNIWLTGNRTWLAKKTRCTLYFYKKGYSLIVSNSYLNKMYSRIDMKYPFYSYLVTAQLYWWRVRIDSEVFSL